MSLESLTFRWRNKKKKKSVTNGLCKPWRLKRMTQSCDESWKCFSFLFLLMWKKLWQPGIVPIACVNRYTCLFSCLIKFCLITWTITKISLEHVRRCVINLNVCGIFFSPTEMDILRSKRGLSAISPSNLHNKAWTKLFLLTGHNLSHSVSSDLINYTQMTANRASCKTEFSLFFN